MESPLLGLVLDSCVFIAAARRKQTLFQVMAEIQRRFGPVPVAISAVTVAELGHGIYRANTPELSHRRRAFLDNLKRTLPIYPLTAATAEIIAKVGGEQAAEGNHIPLADLMIGACALELRYAVGTLNLKDFQRIPGLTVIAF